MLESIFLPNDRRRVYASSEQTFERRRLGAIATEYRISNLDCYSKITMHIFARPFYSIAALARIFLGQVATSGSGGGLWCGR